MHITIKGNYISLDGALSLTAIRRIGCDGCEAFYLYYENTHICFFYNPTAQNDVLANRQEMIFGTRCFFEKAYKEIFNLLTNATKPN